MAGSTISSTITTPVTLGVAGYTSSLTITSKGAVETTNSLAGAIYVPSSVKGAVISNAGVLSSQGDGPGPDDATVEFSGTGSLVNTGIILSGSQPNSSNYGDQGGTAVYIKGSVAFRNFGTVIGGVGGSSHTYGADGGIGLAATDGTIWNYGFIKGGQASPRQTIGRNAYTNYSSGGAGTSLSGTAVLINDGMILGGAAVPLTTAMLAGQIEGGFGVLVGGQATLINHGTIFEGLNNPTIVAFNAGVEVNGSTAGFINTGTIATSFGGYGLLLVGNATVTNSGTIIGGSAGYAIGAYAQSGTLTNAGVILAPDGIGVRVGLEYLPHLYGSLINTGTIISGAGMFAVEAFYGASYVKNSGLIKGGTLAGAYVYGGVFINSGTITSTGTYGVYVSRGGTTAATVITSGYIHGGIDALTIANRLDDTILIVEPHATFSGDVIANPSFSDILEVTGTSTTALSGIGTSITNFKQISFASGARWTLEGNTIGLATGQTISGFTVGDTIILDGFAATSETYSGTGLVLTEGTSHVTLDITGNFTTGSFNVVDPPANTTITVVCYLRGTRILTPAGEVAVEDLKIGDPVITRFNGYRPIKWIGRQSYARRFIAENYDEIPVRISAAALGPGMPKRDLYVSPGHSMLIDGKLILAKSLVNGITITQHDCPALVEYFQLEFETHDCVMAEGAWSESYADTPGLRAKFHNVAEFYKLYPDHHEPSTQQLCAVRPLKGPELDAALRPFITGIDAAPGPLHGCIDDISATGIVRGWAWDSTHPHLPVLLEITAANRLIAKVLACEFRPDLQRAGIGRGHCGFEFHAPIGLPASAQVVVRRKADGAEILPPPALRAAS